MTDNNTQPPLFPIEEWRAVAGFEGLYEVSSFGRVRSLPRTYICKGGYKKSYPGHVLKTITGTLGYLFVNLSHKGQRKTSKVHSLVAAAFLPKPPREIGNSGSDYGVNHKDGNKLNNRVGNLEYITNLDNLLHARKNGLLNSKGVANASAKIGPEDVREIRRLHQEGWRQIDLAERFGLHKSNINHIVLKKTWKHIK